MAKKVDTATGTLVRYLPAGKMLDELLITVRMGAKFKQQQRMGKRPGRLALLVRDCVRRAGPPYTFAQLLAELRDEAVRRALDGERASPVEEVNPVQNQVIMHLKADVRRHVPFGTLRTHLTHAKIFLNNEISQAAKPRKRPASIDQP